MRGWYALQMFEQIKKLRRGDIWPPIDYELEDIGKAGRLSGMVLNAGAGWRDLSHLIDGKLVNQDITWDGDTRTNIDLIAPLHSIPVPDNTFDAILCIAVLEHVQNPIECVAEMVRVLKNGGTLVASVPFIQPEHKVPTDYQRYTRDGLTELFSNNELIIEETLPIFSIYHTLYWIAAEWLKMKNTIIYKVLRVIILMPLAYMALKSRSQSDILASAFRIVAVKRSEI